jgi:hypothetical protein
VGSWCASPWCQVAFNFVRAIPKYLKPESQTDGRFLSSRARNLALVGLLLLNVFAFSAPYLIDAYNKQQARIPKPLAADTTSSSAPAADAEAPAGAAAPISQDLAATLAAEKDKAEKGRKDERKVQLLAEGRTSFTKIYKNADGSKTLEESLAATSFQDSTGAWKDVDASLAEDSTTGKWQTKANDWKTRFGKVSANGGVELIRGSSTVTFAPVGATTVDPVVTGTAPNQVVTYRNAWQGIDLVYTVNGSELKEQIVVKSKAAATSFKFDIAGTKLTADTAKGSGWFKLDGAFNGFTVAAPTVATQTKGVLGADPTVKQTVAGNRLTVTLDANWLKNRAFEEFPVVIDPTVTNYSGPNNWYASYKSDGFTCNPGQGCGNSAGSISTAYWRFVYHVDYDALIGSNKYLRNATLNLAKAECSNGSYGTCNTKTVYSTHATCWGYNCKSGTASVGSGSGGQTYAIDVTNTYRERIAANDFTAPYIVWGEETSTYSYKLFDHTATSVTFVYDNQPSASTPSSPGDKGIVVSDQPVLASSAVTDPDGEQVFYRYNVTTNPTGNGAVVNSGWTPQPSWSVPDYVLQDGVPITGMSKPGTTSRASRPRPVHTGRSELIFAMAKTPLRPPTPSVL